MRYLAFFILLTGLTNVQANTLQNVKLHDFYNGQLQDNEQFQGKVIYLDFWASWCKPCKKSFPFMNELTNTYPPDTFQVIAINMDEQKDEAQAFLEKIPAEFNIYTNPENTLAKQLEVPGLPVAYIIDKQGNIAARHIGFNDRKKPKKHKQIKYLLEQP
ncbi:MAG: TlpA family protein disulfide reductase [Aestuariibacter sp.]